MVIVKLMVIVKTNHNGKINSKIKGTGKVDTNTNCNCKTNGNSKKLIIMVK